MSSNVRVGRDENETLSNQNYMLSTALINLANMLLFASGLILFILGIQYLTTYRYEFSFTVYSMDMMAGFFIAVGVITLIVSVFTLFALKPFGSHQVATVAASWAIFAFLLLFISGVVGLSLNATGQFMNEIRHNMYQTARQYDEMIPHKLHTRRINWLQMRFECCGMDAYSDWRSIMMYGGVFPNRVDPGLNFNNNFQPNNRLPYTESVPDTCCLQPQPGCGKSVNTQMFGAARDRTYLINTKGCVGPYTRQFTRDVTFVAGIATAFGSLFLFIAIALVALAGLIRTNLLLLESSLELQQEKRRLFR